MFPLLLSTQLYPFSRGNMIEFEGLVNVLLIWKMIRITPSFSSSGGTPSDMKE